MMRKLTALTIALGLSAAGHAFTAEAIAGPRHAPAPHAPAAHAPPPHAPVARAPAAGVRAQIIHGLTNDTETERRMQRQTDRQVAKRPAANSDVKSEYAAAVKSTAKELKLVDASRFNSKLLGLEDLADKAEELEATAPAIAAVGKRSPTNSEAEVVTTVPPGANGEVATMSTVPASTVSATLTDAQSGEHATPSGDDASEIMNFAKLQVQLQAGTSALGFANQIPETALTLLQKL